MNLHPALFMPWTNWNGERSKDDWVISTDNLPAAASVEQKNQQESLVSNESSKSQELLENSIEATYFLNPTQKFLEKKRNQETISDEFSAKAFKEKCQKFSERAIQYNDKIKDGYDHLIKTLQDNKYFDKKSESEQTSMRRDIFAKYSKAVNDVYNKYVRDTKDENFDAVKDSLFTESSDSYPANDVYKKLTSSEIFKQEKQNRQAYDVESTWETLNEGEFDWKYSKFLWYDLPNYLYGINGTKWSIRFQNMIKWVPFLSVSIDKPSNEDKKQIENFVKVAGRLSDKFSSDENGATIEKSLINIFKNAETNWTEQMWRSELIAAGFNNLTDKDVKKVKESGQFYLQVQTASSSETQHNIYLAVMQIIEKTGSCDAATRQFYNEVEESKNNKTSKSDINWESLLEDAEWWRLRDFAEKLWITDFASATRLMKMSDESFSNRSETDIIADLNNDWNLTFADEGVTKTWLQFRNRMKDLSPADQDKAWDNLINYARLLNKTKKLWIRHTEITKEDIKNGDKEVILLLQSIISQPGEDLYTLLKYGPDAGNDKMKEMLPSQETVEKATQELLKNIDKSKLPDGITPEWLNQAVAWALYTEYSNGIWLGWTISFDQFVKGLKLNSWFQVDTNTWDVNVGLTLTWQPAVDLWKGWHLKPGAHIWFTPLQKLSAGAGVTVTREWLNQNSVIHTIWLWEEYTNIWWVCNVYTTNLSWSRDKLAWIEKDVENKQREFAEKITTPLLENLFANLKGAETLDATVLDLNEDDTLKAVRDIINQLIEKTLTSDEKSKLQSEDKESLMNNTIRFLSNFNKVDLSDEYVRKAISAKMAKQYALAWRHQMLNAIDGKTYLSSASIGFSWAQLWVIWVGVLHAWVWVTTHRLDGYGDGSFNRYEDWTPEELKWKSKWTQEMLNVFNEKLWISSKLEFVDDWNVTGQTENSETVQRNYIKIPSSVMKECTVKINPEMKWLINKDNDGNIILSAKTFISGPFNVFGVASMSKEIVIGGGEPNTADRLTEKNLWEWTTNGMIDEDKLPGREKEQFHNLWNKDAFEQLKKSCPDGDPLKSVDFWDLIKPETLLQKWQKVVISEVIDGEYKWKFMVEYVNTGVDSDDLQIEYKTEKSESLLSPEIAEATTNLYAQVSELKTNALNYIKHNHAESKNAAKNNKTLLKLQSDYKNFSDFMVKQDYEWASNLMIWEDGEWMLSRMESFINGMEKKTVLDFSDIKTLLTKAETSSNDKWKVLMSIINMFARVRSVRWRWLDAEWKELYRIDRWFGKVFDLERSKQIKWKINESNLVEQDVKNAYTKLIDSEWAKARQQKEKYNAKDVKAWVLQNAIWINLGDPSSVENPLFNPDVYEDFRDDLDKNQNRVLHEHALKVVAKNPALMSPVLEWLWLGDKQVDNISYENQKLILDISWKKVILDADLHFGYFAQCVNQMIYIDNIQATVDWEWASVNFGPSVFWGWATLEWTKRDNVATTKVRLDGAVKVHEDKPPVPVPPESNPEEEWTPIVETQWGDNWSQQWQGENTQDTSTEEEFHGTPSGDDVSDDNPLWI